MRELKLIVQSEQVDKMVGWLLVNHFKLSKRLITKLKQDPKGILLNGEHVTVRGIVKQGDELLVTMPENQSLNVIPVKMPLDILYEDEDILAVNKPQDMPVHPSLNNFYNTLGNAVMYYYKDRPFVFRAVNRLDRDTTGVVIIAKTPQASHNLSLQMQKGIFKKTYLCITDGVPHPKTGEINAPIRRERESIIKRIVAVSGDTVKIDSHGALLVKKAGETEFEPIYSENCLIPENYKYESSWLTHDDYDEGFLIPDGEYFFLGDNRANSNDSRYDYRTCTREEILGVAGDFLLSLKEEVTDWTIFKDKVRVFFGKDPLLK